MYGMLAGQLQRFFSVKRLQHIVSFVLYIQFQQIDDLALVIHDQYSLTHRTSLFSQYCIHKKTHSLEWVLWLMSFFKGCRSGRAAGDQLRLQHYFIRYGLPVHKTQHIFHSNPAHLFFILAHMGEGIAAAEMGGRTVEANY
ncbi:hypothetical protein D3C74_361420 [compost metagenome]